MASQNDYQLALRIPGELLAAIDAEVERVKLERPGARVQRSDVVREALMRAFFHHPEKLATIVKREPLEDGAPGSSNGSSNGNGSANGNGNGRQQHASRDDDNARKSH